MTVDAMVALTVLLIDSRMVLTIWTVEITADMMVVMTVFLIDLRIVVLMGWRIEFWTAALIVVSKVVWI